MQTIEILPSVPPGSHRIGFRRESRTELYNDPQGRAVIVQRPFAASGRLIYRSSLSAVDWLALCSPAARVEFHQ